MSQHVVAVESTSLLHYWFGDTDCINSRVHLFPLSVIYHLPVINHE